VSIRNGSGGIQRITSIPSSSTFAGHGGGQAARCSITADRDGFELSSGERVPQGTVVTGPYVFVEGIATAIAVPLAEPTSTPPSRGPLDAGTRIFSVFCDRTTYDVNGLGVIEVPITDPLFDPRSRLDDLRNSLRLDRPEVFTNALVDRLGGLVTRYPTWLAIHPSAWRTQRSNTIVHRGATLALYATPRELDFVVDFQPDPARPSPAFRGTVACIPAVAAADDGAALPALPSLPAQAEPGVNGPCTWTPPGPGTVTVTARVTYTVTFWVDGWTEPDEDYVWTSAPTTYRTGDLVAVNTKPPA